MNYEILNIKTGKVFKSGIVDSNNADGVVCERYGLTNMGSGLYGKGLNRFVIKFTKG